MSLTVTIHGGELKQIKRLIGEKKNHGQLYGLWTHSNQPVIQYVIDDPKGDGSVMKFLWENHCLRHAGSWSTKDFEGKETAELSESINTACPSHPLPPFVIFTFYV